MKLLNLTEAYGRHVADDASWLKYEQLYPALFHHYFHFWAKRKYPDIRPPVEILCEQSELIIRRLPVIIRKFESHGFDVDGLSFVLFVGKGCTNGHAMLATARRNFDSDSNTALFQGNDPSDVFKFRAGYLMGLNLVKKIVTDKKLTTMVLLSMSRHRLEQYARKQLIKGF